MIIEYTDKWFLDVAKLIASFRVELNKFKMIDTNPNLEDAKEELESFVNRKYPIYIDIENEEAVGYIVLREDGVYWVEHIYVKPEYRRKKIASLLYEKAESIIGEKGEDTLFNFVHPNNDAIISFLRNKGYTVLNLIEVRKPYKGEKTNTKINVGNNTFDY